MVKPIARIQPKAYMEQIMKPLTINQIFSASSNSTPKIA